VEDSLESKISALRNSLDFIKQQDTKEREEKVLLHRPRPVETPAVAAIRPIDDAAGF